MMQSIQMGEILVEQGVLTRVQVQQVLDVQRRQGRPFGDLVERLFGVDPLAVQNAWVTQYARLAGIDRLSDLNIDPDCTRLLNRRQAWQFHVLPANRDSGELMLITDEAHLVRALNFALATFVEPVYFQIADTNDLRDMMMEHYPVPQFLLDLAASR